MKRRTLATGLLLLVLVLLAAWWPRDKPAAAPTAKASTTQAQPHRDAPTAPAATPAAALPPLPAQEQARMPTELRDLVSLADGGNRRAACQLGSLLSQCALVHPSMLTEQYQDQLRQSEADLSARGELDEANEVARMMLQARTLRQQCGGIPPSLRHRAPAYLRQAALAGEPEAMVRYLRGEAFQGAGAVDSSDLIGPDFDRWRREAPVMLQAALRSGRPEAALLLLEAHSHESTTLSLVTPVNPLLDQAYLRLAQRLFEDFQMPEYWEADEADTELAREADALARQWQRQHFQDRRFSISKDLVGLGHALLPDGESLWPAPEQWRPACAETTEPSP